MNRNASSGRKAYRVQAVDRALDIMECFDFQNKSLRLTEIARATGLTKTTTSRLTSNLLARGYLEFDAESQKYSLGIRLFELGSVVSSSFSLRKAASRHITRLAQETGSTVLLGVHIDDQLMYMDKREGHRWYRVASDVGWRRAHHFGMLGMVLMAGLPDDKVDEVLEKWPLTPVTSASIVTHEAFRERLAEISRLGYVVEYGEAVEGVIGVAAPIRDYSRRVVAAVGVALVAAASDSSSIARTVEAVRSAADSISAELGYVES